MYMKPSKLDGWCLGAPKRLCMLSVVSLNFLRYSWLIDAGHADRPAAIVDLDFLSKLWHNQHGLNQWRASEFSFGVIAQESPSWAGRSSSRGSRSPEAETVCRDCLHILTAEATKFWKFRTIRHLPDSWPDPVTVRLSDTLWGLAPVLAPPWD